MTNCRICRVNIETGGDGEMVTAILEGKMVYCLECHGKIEGYPWHESVLRSKIYKTVKA